MSIQLRQDHKWTEEEKKYARDRCMFDELRINDELELPKKAPKAKRPKQEDVLHLDKDIYDRVVDMNMEDLQSELRRVHIPPQGDESELRTMFAAYLQDERDSGQ